MNRSRQIYVDLDDVLCETARAFITLLESHYNKAVAFDDMTSFDLGISFGLNAAQHERFMHLGHAPEVLSALKPVDGAVDALNEVISMGYKIAVITGRPPATKEVSKQWLDDNHIPFHSLTFVDKYGRAAGDDCYVRAITLDELAQMSLCYAVEDSGTMSAFLTERLRLPVALLERPWNRGFRFPDPQSRALIDRCADWAEIVSRFRLRASRGR